MTEEGQARPILTRRTALATVVYVALVSSITGFNLARDGAGVGRIALNVALVTVGSLAAGSFALIIAKAARRYRDTRMEPAIAAAALAVVWVCIVCLFLIGAAFNDQSPRLALMIGGLAGGVMCVSAGATYVIALWIRRRWAR
jgi:uncharacterized membrane-anchored protein